METYLRLLWITLLAPQCLAQEGTSTASPLSNLMPDLAPPSTQHWTNSGYDLDSRPRLTSYQVSDWLKEDVQGQLGGILEEGFKRADQILQMEDQAARTSALKGMSHYKPPLYHFKRTSLSAKRRSACRSRGVLESSELLVERFNISREHASDFLNSIAFPEDFPQMKSSFCNTATKMTFSVMCEPSYPYRTIDGSCNNIISGREHYGAIDTDFGRYLKPAYGDGVSSMRGDGYSLPKPRAVSAALSAAIPNPPTSSIMTQMLKAWGQFLDHDIALTAESGLSTDSDGDGHADAILCCDDGTDDSQTTPECRPIDVSDDAFFGQFGTRCLRFVRSLPSHSGGVLEQVNEVTAFVDGSNVYGSTVERARALRSGVGGKLRENAEGEDGSCVAPSDCNLPFLPLNADGDKRNLFFAGDIRVNEQPGLTGMHTLFVRYHNLIAESYYRLNPRASDNTIYEESRRIVGAVMQHITYNEFIPLIVGKTAATNLYLYSLSEGYVNTYKYWINPSIKNSFATAAYRLGHTLVGEVITGSNKEVLLSELFFNNDFMMKDVKMSPSKILKGECEAPAERYDAKLIDTLTNKLFAPGPDFTHGSDLMSLNINRGRDHGIPSYNEFRVFCGNKRLTSFNDLTDKMDPAVVNVFRNLYRSVDDIDLFPAGLAEYPIEDGFIGDTFACILSYQFHELKYGDRFWYESSHQPKPFTQDQLKSIRKVTLASVLCDTNSSKSFQPYPMINLKLSQNIPKSCSEYNKNSLLKSMSYWSD